MTQERMHTADLRAIMAAIIGSQLPGDPGSRSGRWAEDASGDADALLREVEATSHIHGCPATPGEYEFIGSNAMQAFRNAIAAPEHLTTLGVIAYAKSEISRLTMMIANREQALKDHQKWENGIRNIVTTIWGPNTEFQIADVVHEVASIKGERDHLQDCNIAALAQIETQAEELSALRTEIHDLKNKLTAANLALGVNPFKALAEAIVPQPPSAEHYSNPNRRSGHLHPLAPSKDKP